MLRTATSLALVLLLAAGCGPGEPPPRADAPPRADTAIEDALSEAEPAAAPVSSAGGAFDIAYERYVLENGLTLIVHEDRKAPIVAVNVWYHVGSKDERPGRTGFAHLFEHLMFNGSENHDAEYFEPFDRVGATGQNGTTNFDRTNYFQTVPSTALDLALWMESDRMGHLLGAVTREKLDEQRDVVKNEKRQGENEPYGKVFETILRNVYPAGHPYSWETIGSMEDLDAASLEDVQTWFRTWYGPNNATLVVAGDVVAEEVLERVRVYFGDIPPGPPLSRQDTWIAKRTGTHRQVMQDRVPQARVYRVWNVPGWGSADADYLELAASALASGKNSRLYERLVYREQIATDVAAYPYAGEIGGLMMLWATAHPGEDPDGALDALEAAMEEELVRFLEEGPTERELERVRVQARSGFIRGMERIGGFGGKSDILAENQVYAGDPLAYRSSFDRLAAATPEVVRDAARRWLSDGDYVLRVLPFEDRATAGGGADRTSLPFPDSFPEARFPEFERGRLSNGLELVVATRRDVPVVNFNLLLDAGYAADQFGRPGTASLAMSMLDEGTESRDALEISDELSMLGASIGAGSSLDVSSVTLSSLTENLDASLDLYADIILRPSFPENEFERLRRQQLASIQREKSRPVSMGLRVLPRLLYGEGHAYDLPLTGSGTEATVTALEIDDLKTFHETWFRPDNGTLIVVGDTDLASIQPRLEALFADWEPGPVPEKNVAAVDQPAGGTVYLVDRPEAEQSVIFAAQLAPPTSNPDEIALQAMNEVLGGDFTSRINMNLREDKNWSYGAFTALLPAEGQRPFFAYAPVQTDSTAPAIREILAELEAIRGDRPPTPDEVDTVKARTTLSLPGRWETGAAVAGSLAEIVRYGLPDDWWSTYSGKVRALDVADVAAAATALIVPDRLVWVIVGDLERIEPEVRDLGLGRIVRIDADGGAVDDGASGR
jgi:zinc protease